MKDVDEKWVTPAYEHMHEMRARDMECLEWGRQIVLGVGRF